jgi:hypothetical protein
MDPELEQLIARLFDVAGSKGLSSTKAISLVLEAPTSYENTQVVVSFTEPYNVTAPLNIVWLVADSQNVDYGKILKRQSRIASASYSHTWNQLTTYASFFVPPQVWDIPEPGDQDHIDHSNNIDNPHRTTAQQIGALSSEGGDLTGPLTVRTDVPGNDFGANEVVAKSWIQSLVGALETRFGGFSQGLSYVINQLNILKTKVNVNHENRILALEGFTDTNGYVHAQSVAEVTWEVAHNLDSSNVLVQVFDNNNKMVIPAEIEVLDSNNVSVVFAIPIIGIVKVQPVSGT